MRARAVVAAVLAGALIVALVIPCCIESGRAATLTDMKDALARRASFQDMQAAYGLEITETTVEGIGAANSDFPDIGYGFSEEFEPGVFRLDGVAGPASFILPEYAGKRLDDIPILDYRERDGSWASFQNGPFFYNAELRDSPGVLAPDAMVGMGFEG